MRKVRDEGRNFKEKVNPVRNKFLTIEDSGIKPSSYFIIPPPIEVGGIL